MDGMTSEESDAWLCDALTGILGKAHMMFRRLLEA